MSLKTPRSSRSRYISRASPSSSSNSARCSSGTLPRTSAICASTSDGLDVPARRRRRGSRAAARRAARARRAPRCRSRRGAGSRRGRGTPDTAAPVVAVERAQRVEHAGRDRRPTSRSSCARGILPRSRRSAARARADAPADTGAAPRIRPSSSAGGRPVQSPTCARKSPVGTIAAAVKRMCWVDHRRVVVAAARQVRDQLVVGERVGVDRLQLAVGLRSRPA